MQAELDALDPIRELRLRTWARRNHVPAADRDDRWHVVILDEMARTDLDIAIAETTEEPFSDWIGPMLVEASRRVDVERAELAALRSSRAESVEQPTAERLPVEPEVVADEPLLGQTVISAFVPLAPGSFRMLHEAHVTPPAPHFGTARDRVHELDRTAVPECW